MLKNPAWRYPPTKSLANTLVVCLALVALAAGVSLGGEEAVDYLPRPDEQQLPCAMHSAMEELPRVTVGLGDADLVGSDQRVLQAAVDYVAGLGGGVVDIGPGDYLMRDLLHLRSNVRVRGRPGETRLRKADAAGIRIRGETNALVFERNTIRDTREGGLKTQTVGILIEPQVGELTLIDNTIEADLPIDDRRRPFINEREMPMNDRMRRPDQRGEAAKRAKQRKGQPAPQRRRIQMSEELRRKISPMTYVSADAPPLLIIHDTADRTVSVRHGDGFSKALQEAGAKDVTYMRFDEGLGHGVFTRNIEVTGPAREAFFERTLKRAPK